MAAVRDALGLRGEAIFRVLITAFHSDRGPLFNPQFLGDKWPSVDFIVELLGTGAVVPYSFVQVRATRQGYTRTDNRLKVQVSASQLRDLTAYPAPTYIVGVDEVGEHGYLVAARLGRTTARLPSMSTRYPINADNRQALWQEVRACWKEIGPARLTSRFVDQGWR